MRSIRLTLFAIFSFLLILQLSVCVLGLRQGSKGSADFRHLYTAGYMVRSGLGHDLYNYELEEQLQDKIVSPERPVPFDHLAYEALLFVPFSLVKYSTAYFAFAGFNLLLLVAAQQLFRPYLQPLESLGKFVPEAIFFCFLPMAVAIILGQDSILLLALAVLAFVAMDKGHDARAGFLFSFGFFKFQLILPVILLFFLWRKWRFVLGAALGGIAAIALSTWVAGVSGMRAFVITMVDMSVGLTSEAQRWKFGTYPSVMPNLRGFIDTVGSSHFSSNSIQVAVLICTVLVILVAFRMRPSLPLALLVTVLVSYHGLIHDSTLLALPLGMLLVQSVSEKNLLLGTFDLLLFTAPAILFEFLNSHYFPMAILILVLLFLWRSASAGATTSIGVP